MAARVFIDATTLNHFASVDRLDLLRRCCRRYQPPMWADEVSEEVADDANPLRSVIQAASSWLGVPEKPATENDLAEIARLQIALNDGESPATKHLGEAQSIYFAQAFDADLITDDGGAFDFGQRRLGVGRVRDTIDLLRGAVAMDDLAARGAADLANAMLGAGRWFKAGRPTVFDERFFDE